MQGYYYGNYIWRFMLIFFTNIYIFIHIKLDSLFRYLSTAQHYQYLMMNVYHCITNIWKLINTTITPIFGVL